MNAYRTHTCGELRKEHIDQTVKISGWVHSVRDHGGVIFIDLRDHFGLTQVVIYPQRDFYQSVENWRTESVLCFTGKVIARAEGTANAKLDTGDIEVVAEDMEVLGESEVTPFQVAKDDHAPEHIRLKYRFLDLRREKLHKNIVLRSQIIAELRRLMTAKGFNEFQTPILTASSPEGARDFLVPSRLHPGKFYALPQAPQQFKQLLMVSGFDKYFQIAPCFRDEDARADRSPGEFYQLDIEMSFVTQDDIFEVVEDVVLSTFKKFSTWNVESEVVRIPYREAMRVYGSDKPDLRNPLKIIDITEIFKNTQFKAFGAAVEKGGVVRAIAVKGIAGKPRSFFDTLVAFVQEHGAKGLAYIVYENGEVKSPIVKFLSEDELANIKAAGNLEDGDAIFFLADKESKVCDWAGKLRTELANRLDLIEKNVYRFCWIVDFPMFELDEETQQVGFSHNPFSMPQGGMDALLNQDPLTINAFQYDLVCNGVELSSGAIRNHRPEVMYKAFEIAGYGPEVVEDKFGGMLSAFRLGAPPHGGIAPGVDRMVMLIANEPNIREVIAFPFNQQAQDLMMNAPSPVALKQLRELHIQVKLPEVKKTEETPAPEAK